MKTWLKDVLILAFAVAICGGVTSPAFAVYGDGAGDGGQFVNKKGKPVAGAKVRITQIQPDGTKKTTETETDDRGFFYLPFSGGDVSQIQFIKDGKTSTFSGPFYDLSTVPSLARLGKDPDDLLLEFDMGDSDEEGGVPWIPNIANVRDWFGGPDVDDDMYPWRVQNPGGPTFSTGAGVGYLRQDYDLNFLRQNVTAADFNPNGMNTNNPPNTSGENKDESGLTRDFDPNIQLNIAFAEVFMTMPKVRFSKYRLDNALNVKLGGASVGFKQNQTPGQNNQQAEWSGNIFTVGLGGSHVMYAPGSPIFLGLNWGLMWVPTTDLDRDPLGSPSTTNAGTVLRRDERFSYYQSNVSARVGWVASRNIAPYIGLGGSWDQVDLQTNIHSEPTGFPGYRREERVDREYSRGGAFGLVGADFRAGNTPFFGRVESQFNGNGYGLMFKVTMPFLFRAG